MTYLFSKVRHTENKLSSLVCIDLATITNPKYTCTYTYMTFTTILIKSYS